MSRSLRLLRELLVLQRTVTPLLAAARQRERPVTEREEIVRAVWEQFANFQGEERRRAFELCAGAALGGILVEWLELGGNGLGLLDAYLDGYEAMETQIHRYPGPITDPEEERAVREQAEREREARTNYVSIPSHPSGEPWTR